MSYLNQILFPQYGSLFDAILHFLYIRTPVGFNGGLKQDQYNWPLKALLGFTRFVCALGVLLDVHNAHVIDIICCCCVVVLTFIWAGHDTHHQLKQMLLFLSTMVGGLAASVGGLTALGYYGLIARGFTLEWTVNWIRSLGPQPLQLKNGGFYGPSWFSACVVNPERGERNLCGWKQIFVNPREAQRLLSTNVDGKMTRKQVNEFNKEDIVQVWTDNGRHMTDGANTYCMGRIMYIKGSHAKSTYPDELKNKKTFKDYLGVDIGIVIPIVSPRVMRVTEPRSIMEDLVTRLSQSVDKSKTGMVAECGLIAAREELDIIEDLCIRQDPNEMETQQIRRVYLTNPKRRVFDTKARKFIVRELGKNWSTMDEFLDIDGDKLEKTYLAWTGNRFVETVWISGQFHGCRTEEGEETTCGRYLIFMEDLPYRRGLAYAKRCLEFLEKDDYNPVATLVKGVPSCGKSTEIVKEAITPSNYGVTCNKEAAVDLIGRGCTNVRTIDSIVVNGWDGEPVNDLLVDEGLLAHCGALELLTRMIKPKRLRVFGDPNQLRFIPRLPGYKLVNENYPWTTKPENRTVAYKNPEAVCSLLRDLYPDGYECGSGVQGEVEKFCATTMEGVRAGYEVYLTYTQNEKAAVKQYFRGAKVLTIHEAQGLRFETVALVRLLIYNTNIYNSVAHNIVAVSRSSNIFHYYSAVPTDLLSTWIKTKQTPKIVKFDEEKPFLCEPYIHRGGRSTVRLEQVKALNVLEPVDSYWEWMKKTSRAGFYASPNARPFLTWRVIQQRIMWVVHPVEMPTVESLQLTIDNLYHRRDPDIAYQDRLEWPIKWPAGMLVDVVKSSAKPSFVKRMALTARLFTPQPDRALRHPLDMSKAFMGRVIDAPRQRLTYDPRLSDEMFKSTLNMAFDTEKIKRINQILPLDCGEMKVIWWNTRDEAKRSAILATDECRADGCRYTVIVRGDHKPKLGDDHTDAPPTGQLVTAMDKFWGSVYAPIFQTMLIKVIACLKPHIIFNTRMTWEELDATLDNLLTDVDFKALELDIGKFDKSQDETMLDVQCKFFILFGMEKWAVELWRVYHELCKLSSPTWGVRFNVGFQRRSGDPLTWLGNTLVLLIILCQLYDLNKAHLVVLAGDDNLSAFPVDYHIKDQSKLAAEKLNFELKPLSFPNSMYFTSRFVVLSRFGWTTVADPVKLIVRLGRSDMQGKEHLNAIYDSMVALHYKFRDREIRLLVSEAARLRYSHTLGRDVGDIGIFADTVGAILDNKKNLMTLFRGTKEQWNLSLDPYEKVGGGLFEKIVDVFTDVGDEM